MITVSPAAAAAAAAAAADAGAGNCPRGRRTFYLVKVRNLHD